MSFDLYFAGSPNLELDKYMMNKGCCRLQSQLNERKRAQLWIDYCKEQQHRKIFIDSGAFYLSFYVSFFIMQEMIMK